MNESRTVAVVTGTRAEFGLLEPVMRAVAEHPSLTLQTVVTGMHLVTGTRRDVEAAGFAIDAEAAMQREGEVGRLADAAALGRGVAGLAEAFERLRPAFVVVLGDRVEAFAAAASASVGGVRVAHLHGGDRAEGVADEAMRHAITKLAHLHLPATAQSAERITRMGEPAERVHVVGSPAIDGLDRVEAKEHGPKVLVLLHPVGDDDATERRRMAAILDATADADRLVMTPNHDPGRAGIVAAIGAAGVDAVPHLPRGEFLSLLKAASVIVGNSSAGLIEAAALGTPCVNLGTRQAGRETPGHVVHCDTVEDEHAIRRAIERTIRLDLSNLKHPYGNGRTGQRVAKLLAEIDLDTAPLRKRNAY